MTRIRRSARIRLALAAAFLGLACIPVALAARSTPAASSPIRHVVIVYQENHSFDNVLGRLCVVDSRCDGAVSGSLPGGRRLALRRAADVVPEVEHTTHFQQVAIAGG